MYNRLMVIFYCVYVLNYVYSKRVVVRNTLSEIIRTHV